VALVVPCHRIVRTGGGLGGYYFGLDTKSRLLAHERGEQTLAADVGPVSLR
jgi:O6-methylguanine-DNA--protein-cysteine methyltransferase